MLKKWGECAPWSLPKSPFCFALRFTSSLAGFPRGSPTTPRWKASSSGSKIMAFFLMDIPGANSSHPRRRCLSGAFSSKFLSPTTFTFHWASGISGIYTKMRRDQIGRLSPRCSTQKYSMFFCIILRAAAPFFPATCRAPAFFFPSRTPPNFFKDTVWERGSANLQALRMR